mmetsp:Transcript_22682/g.28060  ORF Transcript_22682/g.28060 Transcript_22682/m.28060 type:complete len:81 (+) Transcript_22682:3218-3460(+)
MVLLVAQVFVHKRQLATYRWRRVVCCSGPRERVRGLSILVLLLFGEKVSDLLVLLDESDLLEALLLAHLVQRRDPVRIAM